MTRFDKFEKIDGHGYKFGEIGSVTMLSYSLEAFRAKT